jgi:hypothetical protein
MLWEQHRLRMFKNKVMNIFGPKNEEGTGEWRRLLNEELYNMYSSPNIIRVIKSRRMKWVGHVARMSERRGVYRVWWGNLRERGDMENLGIEGRIL